MMYLDLGDLADELDSLRSNDDRDDDDNERMAALESLAEQLSGDLHSAADDDPTLIPEYEFEDYARELADDIGYMSGDNPLLNYVDWERWARDVQMDYTPVEFEGTTYYTRS